MWVWQVSVQVVEEVQGVVPPSEANQETFQMEASWVDLIWNNYFLNYSKQT